MNQNSAWMIPTPLVFFASCNRVAAPPKMSGQHAAEKTVERPSLRLLGCAVKGDHYVWDFAGTGIRAANVRLICFCNSQVTTLAEMPLAVEVGPQADVSGSIILKASGDETKVAGSIGTYKLAIPSVTKDALRDGAIIQAGPLPDGIPQPGREVSILNTSMPLDDLSQPFVHYLAASEQRDLTSTDVESTLGNSRKGETSVALTLEAVPVFE